jgi:hypothetical protein
MVKKNGKIQNEINERIRKASKFHHLIKSILWNEDINRKCKTTIYNVYFKKIPLRSRDRHALRERKTKYMQLR